MTKVNKTKLFMDYIKEDADSASSQGPFGVKIKMLNDLALKQAELEDKIEFIMSHRFQEGSEMLGDDVLYSLEDLYEEDESGLEKEK